MGPETEDRSPGSGLLKTVTVLEGSLRVAANRGSRGVGSREGDGESSAGEGWEVPKHQSQNIRINLLGVGPK